MTMSRRSLGLILSALAVAPASAQSRLARPTIDTINHHVIRVMNNGPTAWADTSGWKLMYERTVQPPEGAPGMFTNPSQVLLLGDGRLIIAQRDPMVIMLYDAQGKFVRRLGRQGEGPGEYQSPHIALKHDTLVIYDGRLGRATIMTLDGKEVREFLTNIHADGPPISVDSRNRLRVQNSRPSVSTFQPQWVHFDLSGRRLDSLLPPHAVKEKSWDVKVTGGAMSMMIPFAPQNSYAFFDDGSFIYGGQDRVEFLVSREGGDTTRIFGRNDLRADPIPSATRDSMVERYSQNAQLRGVMTPGDVPKVYVLWNEIAVDGRGNAWVARGRQSDHTARLDVYDGRGFLLGSVAAPFTTLWRTAWSGDRIAVVDTDDNELPRVRIYRVDRRGH